MPALRFLSQLSLVGRIFLAISAVFLVSYFILLLVYLDKSVSLQRESVAEEMEATLGMLERGIAEQAVVGDYTAIAHLLDNRARQGRFETLFFVDWQSQNRITAEMPTITEDYPSWFGHWLLPPPEPRMREIVVGTVHYGMLAALPSYNHFANRLWQNTLTFIELGLAVMALMLLASSWVLRRGLRPLATLRQAAGSMLTNATVEPIRLHALAPPEISTAITAFNDVMAREARARAILEGTTDAYLECDPDWRLTYINRPSALLFGLHQAKDLHQDLWQRLPELDRDFAAVLRQAMSRRQARMVEGRLPEQGRWLEAHTYPTADGLSIYFRDISVRRSAEEALRLNEERLRSVLGNVAEGIIMIDVRGVIRTFNHAAERMFGYAAAEAIGQNVSLLMPTPYAAEHAQHIAHYVRTGESDIMLAPRELMGRHRDGQVFPIEITVNEARFKDDRIFVGVIRDIRERKRLEAREQSRREILEMLAHGAPLAGVLERVADLVEQELPHTLCSILFLEEKAGRLHLGASPRMTPSMRAEMDAYAQDDGSICAIAARSGQRVVIEDVSQHPFWQQHADLARQLGICACWAEPILDTAGNSIGAMIMHQNDSHAPGLDELQVIQFAAGFAGLAIERMQADEALLRESQRAQNYLDLSPAIILAFDRNGRINLINQQGCNILECRREDILGKDFFEAFLPAESRALVRAVFQRMLAGDIATPGDIEDTVTTCHGRQKFIRWRHALLRDAAGKATGILSSGQDLSERKLAEDALLASEARLNLALEATQTGLWEWNLASGTTFYSDHWWQLLGFARAPAAAAAPSWSALIHPDDIDAVMDTLNEHLDGLLPYYSSEHRKQDVIGNWHWVEESGRVVLRDDQGHPLRLIGTLQLIDARKEAEAREVELQRQLLQSSKMEAIGHLTAGIAHDFNNILGAILGYAELSKSLVQDDMPKAAKFHRYLGEILTGSRRARDLIAQMLVFSRLTPETEEAGTPPALLLKPVVKEVVHLVRSSVPSSIELDYQVEDAELQAAIQPVQLHQILMNLCINARDAIGDYGTIRVSLRMRHFQHACASCRQPVQGRYVEIEVADSGSGIPEHVLGRIFDPFFTTKEVGKGSGMGLSVVHGLLHALGGHVLVASTPGQGSRISILLPPAEQRVTESGQDQIGPAANLPLAGRRIMVVDDEQAICSMLQELLTLWGANAIAFQDSQDALSAFQRYPDAMDLVITDETMPALRGFDMARQMLATRPGLPIILCTGFSTHVSLEGALAAGIHAYLPKPVETGALLEAIQSGLVPAAEVN